MVKSGDTKHLTETWSDGPLAWSASGPEGPKLVQKWCKVGLNTLGAAFGGAPGALRALGWGVETNFAPLLNQLGTLWTTRGPG